MIHIITTGGTIEGLEYDIEVERMYSSTTDRPMAQVRPDKDGLEEHYSQKGYQEKLRLLKYLDAESGREFVFPANNIDLDGLEIALLYKKWLGGRAVFQVDETASRDESFWGSTMNAVKIEIYCALISNCLVGIGGNKLRS